MFPSSDKANGKNRVNLQSPGSNFSNYKGKTKDKVVSITYEEIGLFPRSFSRVFDRFFKQIFSDVENLVIQEYRFYRYLFLTTIQTIFILLFVPLVVNFIAKNYLIRPITEYYWNTKQTEIFLNSYEQKRAFVELQDFEEKLYFESLLISNNFITSQANSSTLPVGGSNGQNFSQSEIDALARASQSTKELNNIGVYQQVNASPNSSNNAGLLGLNRFNTPNNSQNLNNDFKNGQTPETNSILKGTLQSSKGLQIESPLQVSQPSDKALQLNNLQSSWFLPLGMNLPLSLNPNPAISTNNNTVPSSVNQSVALDSTTQQNYRVPPNSFRLLPDGKNQIPLQNVNQYSLFLALADSLQEKTLELAIRYNNHSIESITNFFADFISLITLLYLLVSLEIQINITKSFLLEVFFGLDDSKKSLLILIMTDLLVGYHSSNLWELFFQFIFNHYGIPESQTGIFLLVATLPVLLDVLFKYLIFRHLNRSSPATVATYHAIIE